MSELRVARSKDLVRRMLDSEFLLQFRLNIYFRNYVEFFFLEPCARLLFRFREREWERDIETVGRFFHDALGKVMTYMEIQPKADQRLSIVAPRSVACVKSCPRICSGADGSKLYSKAATGVIHFLGGIEMSQSRKIPSGFRIRCTSRNAARWISVSR